MKSNLFCFVIINVFLVVLTMPARAQESGGAYRKHALYAEGLGQGIVYSLNYDYRPNEHLSLRTGFTSWKIPGSIFLINGKVKYSSIFVMTNYLSGKGTQHFEAGAGIMFSYVSFEGTQLFWGENINKHKLMLLYTVTIGYRLQPANGFLFRIGITPIISNYGAGLLAGISFGYTF